MSRRRPEARPTDPAVPPTDVRALLEASYRSALEAVAPARLLAPWLTGPRPDLVLAFEAAPAVPFLDLVTLRFTVGDTSTHDHVPLVMTPWSYSTSRGS